MNLEQAKQEASTRFSSIKDNLKYADCFIYEDLNIPESPLQLEFAGFFTTEGYESEIIDQIVQLQKEIEVVRIFGNSDKDYIDLMKWMLLESDFRFETNYLGSKIPHSQYNDNIQSFYNNRLAEFELMRKSLHEKLVGVLKMIIGSKAEPSPKSRVKIEKLIWNGEQYHLIELFRTLIARGWLAEPGNSSPTSNARAILEAIDISKTKKKPDSDEVASFIKSYIGESDKLGNLYPGNPEFTKTKGYKPFFDGIKEP